MVRCCVGGLHTATSILIWMEGKDLFNGILIELAVISLTVALHLTLPGELTTGYCCDQNFQPLIYKLNGLSILLVVTILFLLLPIEFQIYFSDHYLENLFGANIIGLLFSFLLYWRGGHEKYHRCITMDQIPSKLQLEQKQFSSLEKFFLGSEWNPRFLGIDSKMILYAIGAVHLQINLFSFAMKEYSTASSSSTGVSTAMILYLVLFTVFLYDYMFFEKIHLYTYDLFAEKLGFKLTWGCLVFYPFFYCIGAHCLLTAAPSSSSSDNSLAGDLTPFTSLLIIGLYLVGWFLTRGANLQKYYFKISSLDPASSVSSSSSVFFGLIRQVTVPGSNNRILCSGFWGVARHVNYLGEIVQSIALTLPGLCVNHFFSLTHDFPSSLTVLSMAYPLYYILLFISRQIDDDRLCQLKYGEVWQLYCQIVPWRIFPGVW